MNNLDSLKFSNDNILEQALTHRSWLNENGKKRGSNERLEFLGDAVLELVTSIELYGRFPKKEEGYLTALRANIVNTINLSEAAKKLGVGERIYLSKGEEEGGGRENKSILADTMEAIIGAIFVDQGLDAASKFIHEHILDDIEEKSRNPLKDPKSSLQEAVQGKGFPTPTYKVVSETGPDHMKEFEVAAMVGGEDWAHGRGGSKSEAEQAAARAALEKVT